MKRTSHKAGKVDKDVLGSFTVAMFAPPGALGFNKALIPDYQVQFSLGAGANTTAVERARLWPMREKLVGRVVKFRYQQVGTDVAPRIPVFLGFRDEMDL